MNGMLSRNKKIKKRIKAVLESLPFGLRLKVVAPLVKWLLMIFFYRTPIRNFRRRQYARNEARSIDFAIRDGITTVTLVYDNFVSPPTYGDYLCVVLLARYFIAHGLITNFIIVDSEYRQDWLNLTEIEKEVFVNEQLKLAEALLDSTLANIERLPWSVAQQRIVDSPSSYVPFLKKINDREYIYGHCFNLVSHLLHHKKRFLIERVLFSYEELCQKVDFIPVNKKYVTWVCRYSKKWAFDRNLSDKEFLSMHAWLKKKYPCHLIMIVSDESGCDYFSKLTQRYNLNNIFSKQYSQSFLGDAALILKSDFIFQVRGGGIGVIPMFSAMPYEIVAPLANEIMWSKSKVLSFQNDSQLFFNRAEWFSV